MVVAESVPAADDVAADDVVAAVTVLLRCCDAADTRLYLLQTLLYLLQGLLLLENLIAVAVEFFIFFIFTVILDFYFCRTLCRFFFSVPCVAHLFCY